MISIKLARHGLKNTPFFHIVVLQSRSRPTRKPIEQLGTFNPIPNKDGSKDITLNFERAKYWISVGAKPSDSVARILAKVLFFLGSHGWKMKGGYTIRRKVGSAVTTGTLDLNFTVHGSSHCRINSTRRKYQDKAILYSVFRK